MHTVDVNVLAIMARNPTNWDEYHYGTSNRSFSISSTGGRSVRFDEPEESLPSESLLGVPGVTGESSQHIVRRRR